MAHGVESTLNNEDEETPDRRINVVELPATSSDDQPWHGMSEPLVLSHIRCTLEDCMSTVCGMDCEIYSIHVSWTFNVHILIPSISRC